MKNTSCFLEFFTYVLNLLPIRFKLLKKTGNNSPACEGSLPPYRIRKTAWLERSGDKLQAFFRGLLKINPP